MTGLVANGTSGLEEVFLANRERLLRFLRARGAGDSAEDLLQEIWLKIAGRRTGPIASPLSYLFRTADLLMIDRYRASVQAQRRDAVFHGGRRIRLHGNPPELHFST